MLLVCPLKQRLVPQSRKDRLGADRCKLEDRTQCQMPYAMTRRRTRNSESWVAGWILASGMREKTNPASSSLVGAQVGELQRYQNQWAYNVRFQVWGGGEGHGKQCSEMQVEVLNLKKPYFIATWKYGPGPV